MKKELPKELRLDDPGADASMLKALTREELQLVPFEVMRWQCKIKFCKHFTTVRDYGISTITGEFWHPRFEWVKVWPSSDMKGGGRQLFFCGKHYKRYKAAIEAGDLDRVPVKRLKCGSIPWGGDDTKKPHIIW